MEEELKHVCRLCKKRYPSGKSLGGHMRSHVIANSNASSSLHELKLKKKKKALVFADTTGYGLRENPRKTWRMVDTNAYQERICKECGKSSQSLKALCGHMSSHSERDGDFTNSWASDEEDDDEHEGYIGTSVSVVGCSSTSYGVEQEQEELAKCLMMLSRDSAQRAGFNFTPGSSDKSSANSYANGFVEMKVKYVELDNSESGYFENGAKDLESTDDSVHGLNGSELLHDGNVVRIADLSPTKAINKAGKYKCSVCLKILKTHQALGGHILNPQEGRHQECKLQW